MIKDGRQVAPTLDGIRDDHLERYRAALRYASKNGAKSIADVGCGIGYGGFLMAQDPSIYSIRSYEIDAAAFKYSIDHYSHEKIKRVRADISNGVDPADMVVAFEILEHFTAAPEFLRQMSGRAKWLFGSVPNQELIPFDPALHKHHVRHYTPQDIRSEIETNGWVVEGMGCQMGKHKHQAKIISDHCNGRTIIFWARARQ